VLLDVKGREGWLLLQRQSVLLQTSSRCVSTGRCKQPACKSSMPLARLAPAAAGLEEGFVPVLVSPAPRLQGNVTTCKLHLFFHESIPTPPIPNRISTHQS